MARANPKPPQSDETADPQGWQALRSELVNLLAEVEGRYAAARANPAPARVAAPARPEPPPPAEDRRRQALRSVKRAVDRLNDRDESDVSAQADPRAALQAAIGEIRARQQAEAAMPLARPAAPPSPRPAEPAPRFDALAQAVESITTRLGRLESELKAQRHTGASIKEIADQVSQVSHVVELLANAVGETGQVKRLENQLSALAQLISENQRIDMSALTRRIDEVSSSVERLADLQLQHVARERDMPALAQRLEEVSATVERLADLQIQHVNREKDLPVLSARIGDVLAALEKLTALQAETAKQGQEVVPALGERLGEVSESVERLVDLQAMHVRAVKDIPVQQDALRAGMHAIEKGVRNVYDRIDAIEKNYVLPPAEFEKLTGEMARFTQAMQDASQPQGLLDLVDALNARVAEIESRDSEVGALKAEIASLRGAVIAAIEPRMVALESRLDALSEQGAAIADVGPRMEAIQTQLEALSERGAVLYDVGPRMEEIRAQLEALNERVAERPATEPSIGQIEAQVRQLVARMDQTGEQLNGLARLYAEGGDRESGPDYEALAELVASRTSEAMRESAATSGMSAEDVSAFEERMSRLFKTLGEGGQGADFSDVAQGIRRVDQRLERLEAALNRLAAESAGTGPASGVTATGESRSDEAMPAQTGAGIAYDVGYEPEPAEEQQVFTATAGPRRSDAMPASPAEERPLLDRPFPDLGPLRNALEARMSRGTEPLSDFNASVDAPLHMREPTAPAEAPADAISPGFDAATVPRPPRPESSLEVDREVFSSGTVPSGEGDAGGAVPTPAASRNAFIEAARKAAQRQSGSAAANTQGSLIARALARFQGEARAAKPDEPAAKAGPGPDAAEPKQARGRKPEDAGRKRAGLRAEPPVVSAPAEPAAPIVPPAPRQEEEKPESFLSRHRQPILLAASVVALAFLTLNLINQRMAEQQAEAKAAVTPVETSAPAPATPKPLPAIEATSATPTAESPAVIPPRVITMTDALQTGSIDPAAAKAFVPASAMQTMPQAFKAAEDSTDPASATAKASPVKVEMPPEGIGPLELRQAAADGDARAQFEVGAIYTEGRAVPQDLEAAAVWYERAAAQGFAPAQYRLGSLYENGKGVKKDLEQARLWYQRAAESGNRMSMHNLAALYASGDLGKQEFAAAAEWFEKAAERGLTDSQFNLGMLYARGLGVPQNMETSYTWFAIAALTGDKDAADARDDVAKSLSADTVTRLNAEVAAWKPQQIDLAANFAPIGTWSNSFDPGETIVKKDVVIGVQTLLNRLGYDVGTPDGVAGPKTAEAIRQFEKATGMSESGAINPRLLAVLSSQPV